MVGSLVLCPRVSKELLQMFELVDDTVKFTLCKSSLCESESKEELDACRQPGDHYSVWLKGTTGLD